MDFLTGASGRLKTLLDRLTATRAALLDYLDATISSRAPASTAVSNANYTAGRAALLDALGTGVPIKAKSIQRLASSISLDGAGTGIDYRYKDQTVTEVDPAKTLVTVRGVGYASTASGYVAIEVLARLINGTTLRVSCPDPSPLTWAGPLVYVTVELVELY